LRRQIFGKISLDINHIVKPSRRCFAHRRKRKIAVSRQISAEMNLAENKVNDQKQADNNYDGDKIITRFGISMS